MQSRNQVNLAELGNKKRDRLVPCKGARTGTAGPLSCVSIVTPFTPFTAVPGGVKLTVLEVS